LGENKTTKLGILEEMLTVPATETVQTVMPKSMVSDLGWFDSDQTKFED